MVIFRHADDLSRALAPARKDGRKIGFVPTMGALHEGHLSLIRASAEGADATVVSIFVNPTQFNEASDLEKYPRPIESDIRLLLQAGADYLYLPDADDVYQSQVDRDFQLDLGYLDTIMEGAFRPGHFSGVAQVMHLLLDRIRPDLLFMGQKDFQQLAVVRKMMQAKGHRAKLVPCPTIREADGLAMSSRNRMLDPGIRKKASLIYHTLLYAKSMRHVAEIVELEQACIARLDQAPLRPEYFSIVEINTLQERETWTPGEKFIACTAVWADNIRLIDNMPL